MGRLAVVAGHSLLGTDPPLGAARRDAANEVIFLSTERQSGVRVVTRSAIDGGRTVSMAPLLPGTPPDGAAIDIANIELRPVSRELDGELHSYVSTPPGCPASGEWAHSIEFTYADGVTQTVDSASPCSVATGGPCANRLVGSDGADVLVGTRLRTRSRAAAVVAWSAGDRVTTA